MTAHGDLVVRAALWLKNRKRCNIVLRECGAFVGEQPDAIGWQWRGTSLMVECKTSLSDFYRDKKKLTRHGKQHRLGALRYYMTPPGLLRIDQLPDGWGLLETKGKRVKVVREAVAQERDAAGEIALLVAEFRRAEVARASRRNGVLREVLPE